MGDLTVKIDGELTLGQTKDRCQYEQKGGFQLDMIKFGTVIVDNLVIPINKAEFTAKSSIMILDELTFIPIGEKQPDDIRKEMKGEGRTFICQSEIYVEKKPTKIMVFGKNV